MSIKKGGKAKNHKYYMRVDSGNSKYPYIYFYSKDEYQTWLNGKAGSQGKKKTLKTKEEILDLSLIHI